VRTRKARELEDGSTSIYRETGTGWREYRSGGDDADSGDDD
jgi:hypothetical protein